MQKSNDMTSNDKRILYNIKIYTTVLFLATNIVIDNWKLIIWKYIVAMGSFLRKQPIRLLQQNFKKKPHKIWMKRVKSVCFVFVNYPCQMWVRSWLCSGFFCCCCVCFVWKLVRLVLFLSHFIIGNDRATGKIVSD